ncbi:MAG TPA: B12-binding domain-containing protein [Acidimicrobiales bacterium]|nr:B12-binding domain-containing protein [Acidimicrobiales bacterium]
MSAPQDVGVREASEELGLHYMTVYRLIRTGRLAASVEGGEWRIARSALERERRRRARPAAPASRGRAVVPRRDALVDRLLAGDEPGAWQLLESAMASGTDARSLYLDLLTPAMAEIGDRWARADVDVADEHRATAVTLRLLGRLGPRFRPRGRRRGTVVLGAVAGDPHAIPSAVVADLLRGARFDADDLGANVPPPSFVAAAQAADRLRGVAIVATVQSAADGVAATIAALREAGVDAPMVVGGAGVTAAVARAAGADLFTGTAADVVAAFEVSTH